MGSTMYNRRKRLRTLKSSETSMDIDEMIHLASRKLYPLIEMLVNNSTHGDRFLTKQEFANAAMAANVIKEICNVLVYADFKISTKDVDFNLDSHKVTLNEQGQIYVKTGLLLQLIDLYNVLEDARDIVEEFYRSMGINSCIQTDSSYSICSKESLNPNRIVLRLTKPLTQSTSSLAFVPRNFIVMPSTVQVNESKSAMSISSDGKNGKECPARTVKSTGSIRKVSPVTDVYGAKRVVVRCIDGLQEVSNFLDATAIVSIVEVDNDLPSPVKKTSISSEKSYHSTEEPVKKSNTSILKNNISKDKSVTKEEPQPLIQTEGDEECCCPDCFADLGSKADLKECGDDRIIICIKGCNEDDGDIQIVIRQCPDCKKAAEPPIKDSDSVNSQVLPKIVPSKKRQSFDETTSRPLKTESNSLHNKDSQGSYVCSEEEEEEEEHNDKYISLPSTPSASIKAIHSTFSHHRDSFTETSKKEREKFVSSDQQQSRAECSKIRMFETTNLCLQTDTGQELVISVTVTPKVFNNQKLSLRDIFSEDGYNQSSSHVKITENKRRLDSAKLKKTPARIPVYPVDRVIPLQRTKVCSSVDFDVSTLQTRIREKGIQHKNPQILVKLKDLGIDNLLRACRPARCCRKAVLNEKMKKCLPYPPSLRSLPLDEEDISIINQSLQMSLQKVKNSTNLNKDFYANYSYSMKPIQTIMYFFVEQSKHNGNSVTAKLSYYINLVNDIECGTESKFDILYFGVEETSNQNLGEQVKKNSVEGNQNINNKSNLRKDAVISSSFTWGKDRCNKYENRCVMTDKEQNRSIVNINSKLMKNWHDVGYKSRIKSEKTTVGSRIPIYIGKNRTKCISLDNSYPIEEIEQEVYGISLDSLPREPVLLKENDEFEGLVSRSSSLSKEELSNKEKIDPEIDQRYRRFKSPETSRPALFTNKAIIKKKKRKKKAFYLSRSKSDISLETNKNRSNGMATSTQTRHISREQSKKLKDFKDSNMSSTSSNVIKTLDSSRMFLNYFSKMIYKIMVKEALNEKTFDNLMRNQKYQERCSKATDNNSLYELYHRFSRQNNEILNNFEIKHVEAESMYHRLKAKRSQSCIVFSSNISKRNMHIINNLAIQTSVLFDADSKQCQTSNSLVAYLIQPKPKPEDTYHQKKRIFRKIYNTEALSGIPDSCDQLENFIVIFKSDHSLKSNPSDNTDFFPSASEHSGRSLGHFSELTIDTSLIKLKETLEKYETVKNEIVTGSLPEANPIEYFVYQMCACNKFNKKPSVMQKILNKSKGLFTSTIEKDASNKYKMEVLKRHADKRFCYQCGCLISKCNGDVIHPGHKSSDSSFCQCPADNKQKKSHKKNNFSKLTNASMSSVRSLGTYFKKSFSIMKSRSREKNTRSCVCEKQTSTMRSSGDKVCIPANVNALPCPRKDTSTFTTTTKNGDDKVCIPTNVNASPCSRKDTSNFTTTTKSGDDNVCIPANVNALPCPRKDTSTFTTTDSATQKCECNKCDSFADDGTCCCSHCLGCLDKSSDARPDDNNIGTGICIEEPVSKGTSKDKRNATMADSIDHNENIDDQSISSEDAKEVRNTNEDKSTMSDEVDIKKDKATPSEDKFDTTEDKSNTMAGEQVPDNENPNPVAEGSSLDTQTNEEVINLETNTEGGGINHDTTAYYFLTPSSNMFNQFGLGSRNPFQQYLLNFPHVNVVRLDNSDTFLNE